MIIVKLMGGLGNQMFQYAAAKSVALRNESELLIDTSFLEDKSEKEDFTYRNFELNVFQLKDTVIDDIQLQLFFKKVKIFDLLKLNRLNQDFFKYKISFHKIIRENRFSQKIEIFDLISDNSLLEGYWQSEMYFKSYKHVIREEFRFNHTFKNSNLELDIEQSNSVSVHIRRGDYANNTVINNVHGLCSIDYYIRAFEIISSRIINPKFYIFSDDLEWTKKSLYFLGEKFNITFVEQNLTHPSKDLMLMSKCKHNVIANSSFSWWGAWLNENPNKLVIAPLVWTNNNSENPYLVPDNWIRC